MNDPMIIVIKKYQQNMRMWIPGVNFKVRENR